MVGGSFPSLTCRWLASGRWAVFPSYSRHASPSRCGEAPTSQTTFCIRVVRHKPETTFCTLKPAWHHPPMSPAILGPTYWCHHKKGARCENCDLGCSKSVSEVVFDALIAKKKGPNWKSSFLCIFFSGPFVRIKPKTNHLSNFECQKKQIKKKPVSKSIRCGEEYQ